MPLLEVLAPGRDAVVVLRARRHAGPVRADTWELLRKSRLRMAYIGAETASDAVLNA